MKPFKSFVIVAWLLSCTLLTSSCSSGGVTNHLSTETIFIGSTPGDEIIKSLLAIPSETKIDFIRWNLTLKNTKPIQNTFELHLVFGESQPNTLDFKGGGEKRTIEGEYILTQNKEGNIHGEIVHLKSSQLPNDISIVKLNENLLHLLTPLNQLMVGNGGWSYTLNREKPIKNAVALPYLTSLSTLPADTSIQVIFVGRTPCLDFAKENNWNVAPDCFKLKWKLILNKDPQTFLPTTYSLRRVINNKLSEIEGKWNFLKGTASNPDACMYQLDPDQPQKTISLLAGDKNVIFFLDKANELYIGNGDFSFTLNKIKQ